MPKTSKARAVGLNHIALEVGDIEPGRFLDFLDPWGNRIEMIG